MSKTFNINGKNITVYTDGKEFVDVDINDDVIPVDIYSFRNDDRKYGADSISSELPELIERDVNIFSDRDPEEPSDDHYVTLSETGEITLLNQDEKDVKESLTLYSENKILDMALVRIDDNLF